MTTLRNLCAVWIALSSSLFAAGGNTISPLVANDINSAPVVGPEGRVYWLDQSANGDKTLKSSSGDVAAETRPNGFGDFPVGFPFDANATTLLNAGQLVIPPDSGAGFEGTPAIFLNGATKIVDFNSTFPGITSDHYLHVHHASLDIDGTVVFLAERQAIGSVKVFAVCRVTGGSISILAQDGVTPVPGGTAGSKFTFLWSPTVRNGVVMFYGEGGGRRGVYQIANGTISTVYDDSMTLPGATTPPLLSYSAVAFSNEGTDVALVLEDVSGGVWKRIGGTWSLVAKSQSPIPDGTGNFFYFASASLRNGRVAVIGGRNNQFALPRQVGIYLEKSGGGLETVVNEGDDWDGFEPTQFAVPEGGRWWDGDVTMAVEAFDVGYAKRGFSFSLAAATLTAEDDAVGIRGGVSKLDVLANDGGPFGRTLRIKSVTQGVAGKVAIVGGKVSYKPGKSFTGTDTFTYTISAGGAETATATVTVSNPFLAWRGSFNQLVTSGGGATVGALNATLSPGGAMSGKVVVAGKSYTLKGSVDFGGHFTQTFKRKPTGTPDLVVTLDFDFDADDNALVAGQVTGDGAAYVIASIAVGLTALPPGVSEGAYTVVLPADADAAHPRGAGWATAKLTKLGKLTLTGRLGDDVAFSTSTFLNADNAATIYVPLYVKPKGELAGTLTFDGSGARTLVGGTLAWRKPAQAKAGGLFATGFDATTDADGALFLPAAKGMRSLVFTDTVNAKVDVQFTGAGIADVNAAATVSAADKVVPDAPNANKVSATINRATGLLSGKFVPVAGAKAIKFNGVLQQDDNGGTGHFPGAAQTGGVTFTPR